LRRQPVVDSSLSDKKGREILDDKLTELTLLAKKLCPAAKIEVNTRQYEDENGRLKVFPPPDLSETEVEELEAALTEKCNEILEQANLFILCAVFDSQR
jgi:hypothetical protein